MSGISGIGNNISTMIGIAPTKPETTSTPVPAKTETTSNPPYIVDLTVTALAKSMKLQGHTPEQISASMGLDIKTIDSYLNVKPSEPTLIPAPTQTPTTPADLTPSTSGSSSTIPPTPLAQAKTSLTIPNQTPDLTTDPTTESRTAHGTSGIPAVPAALAPPASFSSQVSVNSVPSAMKALGI